MNKNNPNFDIQLFQITTTSIIIFYEYSRNNSNFKKRT